MQVDSVVGLSVFGAVANKKNVKFGSYNPNAARKIEQEIACKGIKCETTGNDFLAECYLKTVKIFEKLFKKSYLPSKLTFENMSSGIYGCYCNADNSVTFNKKYDFSRYYNFNNLKQETENDHNFVFPSKYSSKHPAHDFVHEFSHAAHWNHLSSRNGKNNAYKVWKGLEGTTVPTGIGRLVTKLKLGRYSVESVDMCEFLAERMSQDICNGLTDEYWVLYKDVDVDYSNIFSKKWNYRYSSPQSYIDYFTQQVWNGDIDGAGSRETYKRGFW